MICITLTFSRDASSIAIMAFASPGCPLKASGTIVEDARHFAILCAVSKLLELLNGLISPSVCATVATAVFSAISFSSYSELTAQRGSESVSIRGE